MTIMKWNDEILFKYIDGTCTEEESEFVISYMANHEEARIEYAELLNIEKQIKSSILVDPPEGLSAQIMREILPSKLENIQFFLQKPMSKTLIPVALVIACLISLYGAAQGGLLQDINITTVELPRVSKIILILAFWAAAFFTADRLLTVFDMRRENTMRTS